MSAPFSDPNAGSMWTQPQQQPWNPIPAQQQYNQQQAMASNSGYNSGNQGVGHGPQGGQGSQGSDVFSSFGGVDNPMMAMGVNAGRNFIQGNVQRFMPGMNTFMASAKYYFAVNNSYVANKLKCILFPFMKKNWARELSQEGNASSVGGVPSKFATPQYDENAPDLYLPVMAFMTYVLVVGFTKGTANSFTPEVLMEVTTSCLVMQVLEVLLVMAGCYMLRTSVAFLDLVAYTGYKYLGLCINMTVGLFLGSLPYYLSVLWTGSAMAFFLYKTLDQVLPHPAVNLPGHNRRFMLVAGGAGVQLFLMWWLGYSGDL